MSRVSLVDRTRALGRDRTVSGQDIKRKIREYRIASTPPKPDLVNNGRGRDWLVRARQALARGDYHAAGYAAGVAIYRYGDSGQAWSLLARADAGLERFADAVVEAQRAVTLEPHNADHHATLAGILDELGNQQAALQCYQVAQRLDPGCVAHRVGASAVLVQCGRMEEALDILEDTYAFGVDSEVVGDCLGLALVGAAEQVPQVHGADGVYVVTMPAEIVQMRRMLQRAALVSCDTLLRAEIGWVRDYVDACARREFVIGRLAGYLRGRMYALMTAVVTAIALAGALIARHDNPVSTVIAAVVAVLTVAAVIRYVRVPRWRINKWAVAADDEPMRSPTPPGPRKPAITPAPTV
jgi:tetratricopeptide (TPR) repeat protein